MSITHQSTHRPFHLFQDGAFYFITGRTCKQINHFEPTELKKMFCQILNRVKEKYKIKIFAFVILNNHYHLLCQLSKAEILSNFIRSLHTNTARAVRSWRGLTSAIPNGTTTGIANVSSRSNGVANVSSHPPIWHQYWDYCIRNEMDFWKHFNYIHNNPLKHGLVQNLPQAFEYQFSSGPQWIFKKGIDWLFECLNKFPIIDFSPSSTD